METCAFCGRDIAHVDRMAQSTISDSIYICSTCIGKLTSIFDTSDTPDSRYGKATKGKERGKSARGHGKAATHLTPRQIHKQLNRFIIGQEHAKKVLSVAVCNHNKRLHDKTGLIKKSNILLAGPSGCGKTLLAKKLAEVLDVPFAIADAAGMTEAGYVGENVEVCLQRLLEIADGDLELAQKGIVYLDEIDKIARTGENRSRTRDISGEGVQSSLLKLMEGCEISMNIKKKHVQTEQITFDTSNILFICGGAFEGLFDNEENKSIGFASGKLEVVDAGQIASEKLTQDALKKYGLMPELIGRLPVLCALTKLNEDELVRILTEPEDAITKEYQLLFEKDGVNLTFEEDALKEIARMALEKGTGGRGLRAILENVLLDIMYDIPEQDISKCIVTKECIHTKVPVTVKKEQAAASAQS